MPEPHRLPKIGDIVLYHDRLLQDIWDPYQLVTWPAIVTEILRPTEHVPEPRLRLTAFRPFDKPLWDITATHSTRPEPHHWSWPGEG